jgi:hypothetical protein
MLLPYNLTVMFLGTTEMSCKLISTQKPAILGSNQVGF